jgi:hypothetical protein
MSLLPGMDVSSARVRRLINSQGLRGSFPCVSHAKSGSRAPHLFVILHIKLSVVGDRNLAQSGYGRNAHVIPFCHADLFNVTRLKVPTYYPAYQCARASHTYNPGYK